MEVQEVNIGVVGCFGDLGSKVARQAQHQGFEVYGYDIDTERGLNVLAVDPALSLRRPTHIHLPESVESLTSHVDILHWCAPLSVLEEIDFADFTGQLVLHDSVINNSLLAREKARAKTNTPISIVHFLMNSDRKVAIAAESDDVQTMHDHVAELALVPDVRPAEEHDYIAAISQGLMAKVTELKPELDAHSEEGMLVPSGEGLHDLVNDREARWTRTTRESLVKNPQLRVLLQSMLDSLPPED